MAIKITARVNTSPFDEFADALDNFNEIVGRVGQTVYDDYAPVILQKLQVDPGPVKYPIQWTSEKQRRAFFATDGFGSGIPYQRTGALQQAWQVLNITENGTWRVLITNTAPSAKWVYGGLSLRSKPFQQQFHKNTGWPQAAGIVDVYIDAMQTEFLDRMRTELSDFGSTTGSGRRAFTR